jgi:hypothetical protein
MTVPVAPPYLDSPGAHGPPLGPLPGRPCRVCGHAFPAVTARLADGRMTYLTGCAACRAATPPGTPRR